MKNNFILKTDAYKQTHWLQYPEKTQHIYSYFESRGGLFSDTVFFGLQYILKKHFVGQVVTQEMIEDASRFCEKVFMTDKYFNRKGWQRIVDVHGGRLPVEIKAVPEGCIVPNKNVLMTIVNTDPELPFITNFLETIISQMWYPITVATTSYYIRKIIELYAKKSGGTVSPFHLNDFGFRGSTSHESSSIGGLAHLTSFLGTDTLSALEMGREYYNTDVCGHSVMATEHSTTTIYGKENEFDAYRRFLDQCPTGLISVVADSYNIWDAIKFFGTELKEQILAREGEFSKFVVRPDSGDPVEISHKVVSMMWDYFGGTTNDKGFKTLNPKVGVIYGDGIDIGMIGKILEKLYENKFSVDNIVFGSGGGLLQKVNRDTNKFAFKCCAGMVDGVWRDVHKDPITDSGKSSKKGLLKLVIEDGKVKTVSTKDSGTDIMNVVFKDGELLIDTSLDDIRGCINTCFGEKK